MRAGIDCFFDTNILIYYVQPNEIAKHSVVKKIINEALARRTGAISAQVMQECVNVLFREEVAPAMIQSLFERTLRPLLACDTTPDLIESAIEVKVRWKYHFYDSLIIAGALACNAKILYSEDLQHGQRIENLTIVNPFE